MTKKLILGAPGTGKTTRLLSILENEVKNGTPISDIGFFTFSNAAVEEARRRMGIKDKRHAPWVRTLHSLSFALIEAKRSMVMQDSDYKRLASQLSMPYPSKKNVHTSRDVNITDVTKNIDEQMRLRDCKLEEVRTPFCDIEKLEAWTEAVKEYKKKFLKIDFIDMVNQAAALPLEGYPAFKVVIIDEAQDLSAKQWQIVHKLKQKCERIYIAGDDDQAIYGFNGSEVSQMLALEGEFEKEILSHSWRVPKEIWDKSQEVIRRVETRFEKEVSPRSEAGTWLTALSTGHLAQLIARIPSQKTVMFLARTHSILNRHKIKWGSSVSAHIEFLTIHESKGQEADYVILDLSLSRWTRKLMDIDEETRLFYVGMTRAKECLYVIPSQDGFQL